ncbi:MAG: alanine racemase [Candidatus Puniceispirillaceae bacterium]
MMNDKPHPDLKPGHGAFIINLDKMASAAAHIQQLVGPNIQLGAVVKANAYGHGMKAVSTHLYKHGLRQFYVAQLEEALALRSALPDAQITVFEGLLRGTEEAYIAHGLTACVNDRAQMERAIQSWTSGLALKADLQIDTAMSRLGLPISEAEALISSGALPTDLVKVMSHLACADAPAHPHNQMQLACFSALVSKAGLPASLAASGGVLLGPDYHFNQVRPGILLSGYPPFETPSFAKNPALSWYAPILQIRQISKGESVGYGASFVADKPCRLATLGAGYADGYPRALQEAGKIEIAGYVVPIAGRVSMDLMVVDVTEIPDTVLETASHACLLGPHFDAEDMAKATGTITYEILTGLGLRHTRLYDGADHNGSV